MFVGHCASPLLNRLRNRNVHTMQQTYNKAQKNSLFMDSIISCHRVDSMVFSDGVFPTPIYIYTCNKEEFSDDDDDSYNPNVRLEVCYLPSCFIRHFLAVCQTGIKNATFMKCFCSQTRGDIRNEKWESEKIIKTFREFMALKKELS